MNHRIIDVSHLPTSTFGHRGLAWWATLAFVIIEGTSLAVGVGAYLYLARNFPQWPPAPNAPPDLIVPTIGLVLLMIMIVPMYRAKQYAHRVDAEGVTRMLLTVAILGALLVAVRAYEFHELNIRWDEHAYGSILWLILGLHSTLVLVDWFETMVFLAIFERGRIEAKHYPDIEDAAFYQYFLSLIWVPIWFVLYVIPRL